MDEKMIKNKKSQITIFIILAMILVVIIILLFLLMRPKDFQVENIENPQAYIESCTREFTEEAINILSENGGDINPKPSTMFRGVNITYLYYNANFYEPCIMQRPDLINHIENEITNYIEPRVNNCFISLKNELEKKGYDIEIGDMQLQTKLQTREVIIYINKDFKIQKGEDIRKFNLFRVNLVHPVYSLAEVAMEIANQEAKYCNFDILGYMIFYPDYNLNKFRPGQGDVIYEIKEISTNQKFIFAIRSCALPPGF